MPLFRRSSNTNSSVISNLSTSRTNSRNLQRFLEAAGKAGNDDFTSEMEIVRDGKHRFIIIRAGKDKSIVAYALLRLDSSGAELEQLYTSSKGKGYGKAALLAAEQFVKKQGIRTLRLTSVPQSASFYAHEGYVSPDGRNFAKAL